MNSQIDTKSLTVRPIMSSGCVFDKPDTCTSKSGSDMDGKVLFDKDTVESIMESQKGDFSEYRTTFIDQDTTSCKESKHDANYLDY